MYNRSSFIVILALGALAIVAQPARGQSVFRPPSMTGIFTMIRAQNTACSNDAGDSGTCLAEAECTRRSGLHIGTCANGYGTCCSFKVSYIHIYEGIRQQTGFATTKIPRLTCANQPTKRTVHLWRHHKPERDNFRESKLPQG